MPNKYTITVVNKSGYSASYYFFADIPKGNEGNNAQIYINALENSDVVATDSDGSKTARFEIEKTTYAICATSKSQLKSGLSVTTSDYETVDLGTYNTKASICNLAVDGDGVRFATKTPAETTDNPSGGFVIKVPTFAPLSGNRPVCIGLGTKNSSDQVIPLAISPAKPGEKRILYPVTSFYVATGSYDEGKIVSFKDQTTDAAKVDFTGATNAIVTHQPDGSFSVDYN